jgi:hypothetical protein
MSDAETSAYLLIAGGLTWVLVGIVGLVRRRRGREGNDLEQTLEDRGRAEGEEVDASEECLGELVDLLNSDHPLMRPHVDSIVDPYLLKVGNDNAQKRRELAEAFFDRTEPSQRRTRIHAWINP